MIDSSSGAPGRAEITVATFNVRMCRTDDGPDHWRKRAGLLCQTVADLNADAIGVQEPFLEQIEAIDAALPGYARVGVGRVDGKTEGEWAAIYYRTRRLSAVTSGNFWFSETPDIPGSRGWDAAYHTRICTFATFEDRETGRRFRMFNSHWDNEGALARLHSAGMIAQRVIAAKDDIPAIVTGDFNCTPGSAPVRYLLGDNPAIAGLEGRYPASPGLRDVYAIAGPKEAHDGTFHGFSGVPDGERIDYILATPEIEPVDCRIVRSGAAGRFPSDHFPVVARLRW